ncbi:MAG: glycine cleavage system protein GcvH [Chloroherpetonaceae bacterium]|nr:glycine cleavage system protein GcvH [Chthonomonadaceae bacterium]MDW8208762.1 glycine cleavage system protein GcvH [Chloroherpetonaceae bacterium]
MSKIPDNVRYSHTHEWVRCEGDIATIGITDHAQSELGDITYLDLPEVGRVLQRDERFGEIESVKAVSELFSPVSGEVIEVNAGAVDATEVINEDPYGNGWMVRVRLQDPSELDTLMSAEEYARLIAGDGGH